MYWTLTWLVYSTYCKWLLPLLVLWKEVRRCYYFLTNIDNQFFIFQYVISYKPLAATSYSQRERKEQFSDAVEGKTKQPSRNTISVFCNIIIKWLFEVFLCVCLNYLLNLHETFCIWKFIYLWWKRGTLQFISTPTSSSELQLEFKGNCYFLDCRM